MTTDDSNPIQQIRLARQPIVNAEMQTIGYELLYRARDKDETAHIANSNQATASVIINALTEIGLESVVGNNLAFINVPSRLLFSPVLNGFEGRRIVLEILESIECSEDAANAMNQLKRQGYLMALDDYPSSDLRKPCVRSANFVKFDVLAEGADKLSEMVQQAHDLGLKVVAEKVEDWKDFDRLKAAGVDYFQGHFFARPEMITRNHVRANKTNLLSLLVLLQDEDVALDAVVEKINLDLALSYRLLRLVNSAAIGLRRKVDSVQGAVRMLGLNTIKSMAYLSALTGIDGKPPALVQTAMVRGRFAELLARGAKLGDPFSAFLVGLFSTLDAFYDQPMPELLDELPLSEAITNALLEQEGPLGELLEYITFYERGMWLEGDEVTDRLNELAPEAYVAAVSWAENTAAE